MSTMATATSPEEQKTRFTAEDLWRMPRDGRRYELVKGELVEMTLVGPKHGAIARRLAGKLGDFTDAHRLGKTMVETGFCLECRPDTVRAPDVSFLCAERMPSEEFDGFVPGAPDLAIEIISPGERDADVQAKVMDYLNHGTRLVRPGQRTVTVYWPDSTARVLCEEDALDGEEVAPGFAAPVGKLFL